MTQFAVPATGRTVLRAATTRLSAAGVPTAQVDAVLLLSHVLGVPRGHLDLAAPMAAEAAQAYAAAVARRAAREPLQHIVGTAPFRHLEIDVGPGVFVPRPETELLVDAVLPLLRTRVAPLVVDLCSGSGALALAILDEVPGARVYAVEKEPAALTWLRRNVAGTAIEALAADVTDPGLLAPLRGTVDVVVSNPPYVPAATPVAPEVRADPPAAVFAGPDGLDVLPAVVARAAQLLRPGGVLAVEHDDTHARHVARLLADAGSWTGVADSDDLAGRPRYATAIHV